MKNYCRSSVVVRKFLSFFLFLPVFFAFLFLLGCSGISTEQSYEKRDKDNIYKYGSVVSDEGGITLFGGKDKKGPDGGGMGVNGFLWRASLDTIAFMPIVTADPFGGVITTDWYSSPDKPNERIKVNVFILDRELRADGVRVSVFRQEKDKNGNWQDAAVSPSTAVSLENTILTRARQMRLAQKEKQK